MNVFDSISLAGIVPVLSIDKPENAVPLCKALCDGGLPVAEITFRTHAAAEAMRIVSAEMPHVILGAGTVLTKEQVDIAVAAGASYIVAPGFNPKVVGHCLDKGVPVLPGCSNPSDIERALEFGIDTVKFFPAEALGGLKLIKAMAAPYGSIRFVPTGGISEKNLNDYLAYDKVIACGGSWMAPSGAIAACDWSGITRLTSTAVASMLGFSVAHIGMNSENAESDAQSLAELLGWSVDERGDSIFVGAGFELMKASTRGERGHIAISTNSVKRAVWHLKRRGYAFIDSDAPASNACLQDEFAGFSISFLQK